MLKNVLKLWKKNPCLKNKATLVMKDGLLIKGFHIIKVNDL